MDEYDFEDHGKPPRGGHGTHERHEKDPIRHARTAHDQKPHEAHGHDTATHYGGHDDDGHEKHGRGQKKPPWGNVVGILVLVVLIFLLMQNSGQTKPTQKSPLNVTPGLDNVFNTTIGAILDEPESYKGLTVSVRGVPGYRDSVEAKAKRYDLFDQGRSIRMNLTDDDLPRVVNYRVVARVRADNPKDPLLEVLNIEPVYD